jgi:hypothetical protein
VGEFLNLMILIAISLASLALGVAMAYAFLRLAFACMAPRRAHRVHNAAIETAKVSA